MQLHRLLRPTILDFVTASAILHSATQKGYARQQMDILLRFEKCLLINTCPKGDAEETEKNSTPSRDNLLRRSRRQRLERSPPSAQLGPIKNTDQYLRRRITWFHIKYSWIKFRPELSHKNEIFDNTGITCLTFQLMMMEEQKTRARDQPPARRAICLASVALTRVKRSFSRDGPPAPKPFLGV